MGTFYDRIIDQQAALIEEAKVFFVGSALPGEPVNVSPKGGGPLHLIDRNKVAYLDYPGSGNETARHAAAGGPMTIMIMAMDQDDAAIVRLYGRARVLPVDESPLARLLTSGATSPVFPKPRQIIEMTIDRTQTSCGYGVPQLQFVAERTPRQLGRRFKEPRK